MKEKRIYIVHVDDIPENESFFDWSDEKVIETAKKKGSIFKVEEFIERWNEGFVPSSDNTYMRYLDREKVIIGYQPYEPNGEFPIHLADWWVFKTKEDVESYLKWETFEGYTIEPVYDDDIEEPLIMTFEEYVIKWAISNMNENNFTPNNYEDILIWLRDNGIPKTIGCDIAKRILKYYEL